MTMKVGHVPRGGKGEAGTRHLATWRGIWQPICQRRRELIAQTDMGASDDRDALVFSASTPARPMGRAFSSQEARSGLAWVSPGGR